MVIGVILLHKNVLLGPPIITLTSNYTVSLEGYKVNLLCIAINDIHTNYSIQINWYKGNKLIRQKQKRILIYNIENVISRQLTSSLLFDPIKHTDDGEYTCRAFNHPDSYSKAKTILTVECKVATIHNYMHIIKYGST